MMKSWWRLVLDIHNSASPQPVFGAVETFGYVLDLETVADRDL